MFTALRTFDTAFAEITGADRRAWGGIYARTSLDSPCYDYLFTTIERGGVTLCVEVPGNHGYDPDYWEVVPAPISGDAPSALVGE